MRFVNPGTWRRLAGAACAILLALAAVPASAQAPTGGARVRFAHLAVGGDPVDVYLGDMRAVEALAFGQTSDYLPLTGAAVAATVRPAGTDGGPTLLSLPLEYPADESGYYTVALLDGGGALIAVTLPQDGVPAATGEATAGKLTISGAYVRATAMGSMGGMDQGSMQDHGGASGAASGTVTAAYLTIQNDGDTDDRLVAVSADAAAMVEMHETIIENDVARMQALPGGVPIPAGGRAELKPGGMHLMLMGLAVPLAPGQAVTLTLTFESGAVAVVRAPVRMP